MPSVKKGEFRNILKYCLVCGQLLKLNNNRDINRKKFCSSSCNAKYQAKFGKFTYRPTRSGKDHPNWKGGISKVKKYCKICGKQIWYKSKNDLCRQCFNHNKIGKPNVRCSNCEKLIFRGKYAIKQNNSGLFFCDMKCTTEFKRKHTEKIDFKCTHCEKIVKQYPSQVNGILFFCSNSCKATYYGLKNREKCVFYIDGRTPIRRVLKNSKKYEEWRTQIFLKDRAKCVKCGYAGFVHAHHKESFEKLLTKFFSNYPELHPTKDKKELLSLAFKFKPLWSIENGITLCYQCHQEEHPNIKLSLKER